MSISCGDQLETGIGINNSIIQMRIEPADRRYKCIYFMLAARREGELVY